LESPLSPLTAVGTVIPGRVYPAITIRAISSIIAYPSLLDWDTTNAAKTLQWQWGVSIGAVALKHGYSFHCEHLLFPPKSAVSLTLPKVKVTACSVRSVLQQRQVRIAPTRAS